MYAQPNPKKLAWAKAQADALLAEAQRQREIEQAYNQHLTAQERYVQVMRPELGIAL